MERKQGKIQMVAARGYLWKHLIQTLPRAGSPTAGSPGPLLTLGQPTELTELYKKVLTHVGEQQEGSLQEMLVMTLCPAATTVCFGYEHAVWDI